MWLNVLISGWNVITEVISMLLTDVVKQTASEPFFFFFYLLIAVIGWEENMLVLQSYAEISYAVSFCQKNTPIISNKYNVLL